MISTVEQYLAEGCGRCALFQTPECKVHRWSAALRRLRAIVLASGLTEEVKWGQPCYSWEGTNLTMISAFKECCALSFFTGVLLKDPAGILEKPGENSQVARVIRFTDTARIDELEPVLRAYLAEAIKLEKAGTKAVFKKEPEPIPAELEERMASDPELKAAFEALTPGRRRGYILYISAAKQAKSRFARIEKWRPKILEGKGMHDRE